MSKQLKISDYRIGESVTDFFMVKSVSLKIGSNAKQYLDINLSDSSGEINGKKWDISEADEAEIAAISEGDLVKARGTVTDWNGVKQFKIGKLRKYDPERDDVGDIYDYVKVAPETPESMYQFVLAKAISIGDEDLKSMAVKFLKDNKQKLLYYPGAMRNHHAELGGLLWHIKRMLMMGERACDVYSFLDKDWVVCGVILHDMEKLNELQSNELGVSPGYSFEGKLLGHIAQGVKAVEKLADELKVPEEKKIMLEHMILSHHYEPDYGSPLKPLFPEAELLHYLDMTDAKLYDFEDALSQVAPGEFSERVRTLDGRMLYKPTFKK